MNKLFLFGVMGLLLSGCYKSDWEATKTENDKLKSRIAQLEDEIKKLQETAQYYFQQGQDQLAGGKFAEAKVAFNTVIEKFPNDPLVPSAKKSLAIAETRQAAEMAKQKQAEVAAARTRERLEALRGIDIDYRTFYAKAEGTGLPLGKRYRFVAEVNQHFCLADAGSNMLGAHLMCTQGIEQLDHDNSDRLEQFLKGPNTQTMHVTAEMLEGSGEAHVYILRLE
jgi:hypothetical protein